MDEYRLILEWLRTAVAIPSPNITIGIESLATLVALALAGFVLGRQTASMQVGPASEIANHTYMASSFAEKDSSTATRQNAKRKQQGAPKSGAVGANGSEGAPKCPFGFTAEGRRSVCRTRAPLPSG